MHRIIFIAPDPAIAETAHRVALELGFQDKMRLHVSGITTCLDLARQAETDGADVIVARGWSADLILGSDVRTPVVHIPVGIQDLAEVLTQARGVTGLEHPHIGFVTFPRVHWDLAAFARLLGMHLRVYSSHSEVGSISLAVEQAVRDGADIVVGGSTSARIAQELGTPATLLVSGEDSVRQALLQADKVVYARKLEQTQAQQLRTVLDHSRDGMVSLDPGGHIVLMNPAARQMLRLDATAKGRPLREVIAVPGLAQCLAEGRAIQDEVVTLDGRELLVSAVPVRWQREMTGIMCSFQETRSIAALETKIRRTAHGLEAHYTFAHILGESPRMVETVDAARRYAAGRQSVLVVGETGTGKELFAQAIHNASTCRQGPFVAVNCGALPPSLLESELFGYEAGAFTGANRKGRAGYFELAHGGTLFLDEISELDVHGQTRLLRAVEERSVMRLGGSRRLNVDLRIIAATNVNLWERVRQGRFRQDLFYRLKVLTLPLPPLRERQGDVALLARHFLAEAGAETGTGELRFTAEARRALEAHDWPGNVRELRHLMESFALDAENGVIDAALVRRAVGEGVFPAAPANASPVSSPALGPIPSPDLGSVRSPEPSPGLPAAPSGRPGAGQPRTLPPHPADVPAHLTDPANPANAGSPASLEAQRAALLDALERSGGHQGRAAQLLGLDRSTLYRRMKRLGIRKRLA